MLKKNGAIAAIQTVLLVALASIAVGAAIAPPAHAKAHRPGEVGLADASYPPTVLALVRPRGTRTYAHGRDGANCVHGHRRGFFSNYHAYTWQGGSLGSQRRSKDTTFDYWKSANGGRVEFDGITFTNRSRQPVLVAGWCE